MSQGAICQSKCPKFLDYPLQSFRKILLFYFQNTDFPKLYFEYTKAK